MVDYTKLTKRGQGSTIEKPQKERLQAPVAASTPKTPAAALPLAEPPQAKPAPVATAEDIPALKGRIAELEKQLESERITSRLYMADNDGLRVQNDSYREELEALRAQIARLRVEHPDWPKFDDPPSDGPKGMG